MVGALQTDMSDLSNRLETFLDWPTHIPVKPKDLAEAGFYYIGRDNNNDDDVCCFACGGKYSRWKAGDNPHIIHREHYGERCEFIMKGRVAAGNNFHEFVPQYDPIGRDMENEEERFRSFQRNNGWPGLVSPSKLAKAGFYFTGINDNVKCFACDLSLKRWDPEDDPIHEHMRYQPDCAFLRALTTCQERWPYINMGDMDKFSVTMNHQPENLTGTTSSIGQPYGTTHMPHVKTNESPLSNQQHSSLYTTYYKKPETPNYASEHTRLHTFINWPKECPVRPKELIDAGFYYTGEEDKTTCFKCGIILAGWEPEDTPWGEHEKWCKDCPLVKEHISRRNPQQSATLNSMQPKEQTWVASELPPPMTSQPKWDLPEDDLKLTREPSEQSEEPASHDNHLIPAAYNSCSKTSDVAPKTSDDLSSKTSTSTTKASNITAKTKDSANTHKTVNRHGKNEIFYLQKAVQTLVEQGYNLQTIEETIQYKTKICKETIESVEELHQAVVSFKEGDNESKRNEPNQNQTTKDAMDGEPDSPTKPPHTFTLGVDPEALHHQVKKMHEAHLCKICLDAEIGVLFLPCGHLACCPSCASKVQSKVPSVCPLCRKQIQSTYRTYLP